MMMKTFVALVAVIVAGCATPVPKEASMDWPAFIASVPGSVIVDDKFKTPTLKRSSHSQAWVRHDAEVSFDTWCKTHGGKVNLDDGYIQNVTTDIVAISFERATRNGFDPHGNHHSWLCFNAQQQLMAVMMVYGEREMPIIAFYTPEQAAKFADFYNQKAKEREEVERKKKQECDEREYKETRRLRAAPNVGDQTRMGVIVELRPPLVLIQTDAINQMFGAPQLKWVPINSLEAQSIRCW